MMGNLVLANVFDAEPRAPLRRSSAPASSWIATLLDELTGVATLQQVAPDSRANTIESIGSARAN
jgi:hypothetical protein